MLAWDFADFPYVVRKLSEIEIKRYYMAQEYLDSFNELCAQVVSTIRLQRLTQTGIFWKKRLLESAEEYRQKRLSSIKIFLLYIPAWGMANILCYIILLTIGITFVLNDRLSIGDFVALQGLLYLLQYPLGEFGYITSEFRKSFASLNRLSHIYSEEKEDFLLKNKEIPADSPSTEVILSSSNLGFKYGDTPILKNVNITLKKGDRLGIVGPVGAGKSTLLNILSGLERKVQGDLTFHGLSFEHYSHAELRKKICLVGQKPFLFADNIRENVRLDKNIDDDKVWYLLKLAALDSDIEEFPHKLDTALGEWGINLSGGQKQRLALARALSRQPEILLLDDCLSAVDTLTEEKILSTLTENSKTPLLSGWPIANQLSNTATALWSLREH